MNNSAQDFAVDADFANFEAELVSAEHDESSLTSIDDQIKLSRANVEDKTRSWVTRLVVGGFAVQIFFAVIAALFYPENLDPVTRVIGLSMPIITLVLGYYFGSSSR